MSSLIINKRTKDLVKTGMCKINESPCLLQFEARCFFFVPKGSGMVVSAAWTGLKLFFQSLQLEIHKDQKLNI